MERPRTTCSLWSVLVRVNLITSTPRSQSFVLPRSEMTRAILGSRGDGGNHKKDPGEPSTGRRQCESHEASCGRHQGFIANQREGNKTGYPTRCAGTKAKRRAGSIRHDPRKRNSVRPTPRKKDPRPVDPRASNGGRRASAPQLRPRRVCACAGRVHMRLSLCRPLLALVVVLGLGKKTVVARRGQRADTSVELAGSQVSFSPSNGSAAGLRRRPPAACLPPLEHPRRPRPLPLTQSSS